MKNQFFNKWARYALGEAVGRTIGKLVQKFIGTIGSTLGHTMFVVSIVGIVQVLSALFVWRIKRFPLFPGKKYIIGSLAFGLLAFVTIVLGFTVFQLGGTVGINTFFVTLSIIPGALIDRFFFKHHLHIRQWGALGIGILAGYAILDFPSVVEISQTPLWVWLSLIMTFTLAINQGITKMIQDVNPWVKNFWGGAITLFGALGGFFFISAPFFSFEILPTLLKLFFLAIISGILVIVVWILNLYSYRYGADIAIKKLTVHGSYLILATLFGALLFKEPLIFSHAIGILLYFCAFVLLDEGTWQFTRSVLGKNH